MNTGDQSHSEDEVLGCENAREKGQVPHIPVDIVYQPLHTKALAQIGLFVNEDLSRNNIPKWHEHLQNVLVSKLLREVINEKVCSFWTCKKRWNGLQSAALIDPDDIH